MFDSVGAAGWNCTSVLPLRRRGHLCSATAALDSWSRRVESNDHHRASETQRRVRRRRGKWSGWLAPPQPPPAPKAGALLNELHPDVFGRRASTRRRTLRLKRPLRFLLRHAPRFWCRREVMLLAPLPYQGSVPLAELRRPGAAPRTRAGLSALQGRPRASSSCAARIWGDRPVPTRYPLVHSQRCRPLHHDHHWNDGRELQARARLQESGGRLLRRVGRPRRICTDYLPVMSGAHIFMCLRTLVGAE